MHSMDRNTQNRDGNAAYRHIIKYLGIFGGAHGASTILNILRTKISSILLGVAGQSIITLSNRTLQMFSESTGLSIGFSAVRKISDTFENADPVSIARCIKVVRSIAFTTGIAGMLLMLITTPFINDWIFEESSDYYLPRMMALSPAVLFMAISNGEIAILRGTRHLNSIALYTLLTAAISLAITVPAYCLMGIGGIFPAILATAFVQMCLLLKLTRPHYRYKISPFSLSLLREGVDMIKMGAGYIFASIFTSLSMWLTCAVLSDIGNDETVGLFSAGFVMVTLLPGMLFAALDSEYYPRLSGVAAKNDICNRMVNEQIEVQLLVQPPMLMAFALAMPILVPLFYRQDFAPATAMAQLAMFGMFMRTMAFPISFITLAKNDTVVYVIMEAIYNILFVVLIVAGYSCKGLIGVGAGIAILHTFDFAMVYAVTRHRYGLKLSKNAIRYFLMQLPPFAGIIVVSQLCDSGLSYWLMGCTCVILSALATLHILNKQSVMPKSISRITGRIKRLFKRK